MAAKRQAELQNSRQEAADIVNNAKKSAETQRAQIVEAAQNDAQALQQAQQDAEQARRDAWTVLRMTLQTYLLRLLPSSSKKN